MNDAVLYIDDNQDNILIVQRLFKQACPDVELRTAKTGEEGTRAAVDAQPALILLDNRLPDSSGQQVLRGLAANPVTAQVPVIILSGDSDEMTVRELLAAGAADFLAKPFDIQQLLEAIARYLP
jgi:CheY-like chemotaxis protein